MPQGLSGNLLHLISKRVCLDSYILKATTTYEAVPCMLTVSVYVRVGLPTVAVLVLLFRPFIAFIGLLVHS